jgi:hypothetical protein
MSPHTSLWRAKRSAPRCGVQQKKKPKVEQLVVDNPEPDTPIRRKCRMTWAAVIKAVYEVDPLEYPLCCGTMKIVEVVEEPPLIEKILRHCKLWKEDTRPPPGAPPPVDAPAGQRFDYEFLNNLVG